MSSQVTQSDLVGFSLVFQAEKGLSLAKHCPLRGGGGYPLQWLITGAAPPKIKGVTLFCFRYMKGERFHLYERVAKKSVIRVNKKARKGWKMRFMAVKKSRKNVLQLKGMQSSELGR